jgi:lycopene cyclase domain-containing protein
MEHYLYLLIDFFSILLPLIFSFYPGSHFSKKWKYLWPAIALPAVFFIVWDEWFASMGVWNFNPRYLTGIYFLHLPIEEMLFFICIPYACIFTYETVNRLTNDWLQPYQQSISLLLIFFLLPSGIMNINKWYTSVTFILTALFLLMHAFFWKSPYLGRFYYAFIFILIPFFIVNGVLTGTGIEEPIVRYNNSENLGLRIGTIPFEDTFYGMLLILMNVSLFERFQKRKALIQGPFF